MLLVPQKTSMTQDKSKEELIQQLHNYCDYAGRWTTLPTSKVADFILARESSLKDRIGELEKKYESAKAWSGKLAIMHDEKALELATLRKRVLEPLTDVIRFWNNCKQVVDKVQMCNEFESRINEAVAILKDGV